MDLFSDSLVLPALVLAIAGFAVPRFFARVLPEGVGPLLLNAFASTVGLFALSALMFFLLYLWQGLSVAQITTPGIAANIVFFGRLGLSATLIWAPVMILSLAGLPRRWVHETW